jgi:o-succinylbenzoate synthase
MIQIDRIILREIQLPLVEPFAISSGDMSTRRIFLIEVVDRTGAIGWGECVAGAAPNYSPETIDTAWLMIRDWAAPRLLGRRFEEPGEVFPELERDFRGHLMAKAALEMAAWELEAVLRGEPLAKLLGGTRTKIGTGISIGLQASPDALAKKARASLDEGYRKIKCKIKPGKDLDYLHAVRDALGPDAPIMADANNAYTLDDLPVLKQLDALKLVMIEQPLAWDDVYRHAALQRELETPICLDESITSIEKCEDMIELGAGRIVNIKPGRVGGFAPSIAIHDCCAKHGIPVWCGGMLESGIGRAHNVALASLPNFTIPGDVSPSRRYWTRDIVHPEWDMDAEGYVAVPLDQPGMGVEVDRERIESLAVRTDILEAGG